MIENKIMNYKRITFSLIKIIVLIIIVGLNGAGFLVIDQTFAPFNDTEISSKNTFSASLYFPDQQTK